MSFNPFDFFAEEEESFQSFKIFPGFLSIYDKSYKLQAVRGLIGHELVKHIRQIRLLDCSNILGCAGETYSQIFHQYKRRLFVCKSIFL